MFSNHDYALFNFGPQHPATHGVLRLLIEFDGEHVVSADPHIGLLHRGTEKLLEIKTYMQGLPYFDRLDYVSTLAIEHGYILVLEKLLDISVTLFIQLWRVICLEFTRILNHIMAITTHALDVGALTPFLWGFEEREILMEFLERLSGARMHAAYMRIGGFSIYPDEKLLVDLRFFVQCFAGRIDELEEMLTNNPIWFDRLRNVGCITRENAFDYGFSGPLLRSTGIPWDLRVVQPYEAYESLKIRVPIGNSGDCFDRYSIRVLEMRASLDIINQCLERILNDASLECQNKYKHTSSTFSLNQMEHLIQHFQRYSRGMVSPQGSTYVSVEAPKGEFGVWIVAQTGSLKPYRCHIKAPGLSHLQALSSMSSDLLMADVVTIIGTQDIVFGEVDR